MVQTCMVVCADKDGTVRRRNVSFAKRLQSPSAVETEKPHGVAEEASRPLQVILCCCPEGISSYEYSGTSVVGQVSRLPYVLTDTISTGFTTWTTRLRFHYTVSLVFS